MRKLESILNSYYNIHWNVINDDILLLSTEDLYISNSIIQQLRQENLVEYDYSTTPSLCNYGNNHILKIKN